MKVLVLGLDGVTWDILDPLISEGHLPNLARLRETGASGSLDSVFPPLSPVAWTGVMTGKNSGKHGVFEFLEYGRDPLNVASTPRARSRPTCSGRLPVGMASRRWRVACR